jgi:hypothetical protein
MTGKMLDVTLHIRMKEGIEVKGVHFRYGLLRCPVIKRDSISGDEYAGAIFAVPAMDEHRLLRVLGKCMEEFADLLVARIAPAVTGNQNEFHAKAFGVFLFIGALLMEFAAQINNRGDALFSQRFDALLVRLRAAIQMLVDFSGTVDAIKMNFFRERRFFLRRRVSFELLRENRRRGHEEKCERSEKRELLHSELDAKSLEKICTEHERAIPETAPLDIDALGKS